MQPREAGGKVIDGSPTYYRGNDLKRKHLEDKLAFVELSRRGKATGASTCLFRCGFLGQVLRNKCPFAAGHVCAMHYRFSADAGAREWSPDSPSERTLQTWQSSWLYSAGFLRGGGEAVSSSSREVFWGYQEKRIPAGNISRIQKKKKRGKAAGRHLLFLKALSATSLESLPPDHISVV